MLLIGIQRSAFSFSSHPAFWRQVLVRYFCAFDPDSCLNENQIIYGGQQWYIAQNSENPLGDLKGFPGQNVDAGRPWWGLLVSRSIVQYQDQLQYTGAPILLHSAAALFWASSAMACGIWPSVHSESLSMSYLFVLPAAELLAANDEVHPLEASHSERPRHGSHG